MELQQNNAKPQQEYPHVQYPQNQNAYRNEAADMKVWFLEQKLRQLELFCCYSISNCSILCVAIIFDLCNSLFFPLML
jgi:hypothetical protein